MWGGLRRYQPFILVAIAIVLVAWLLPGKTSRSNSALTNGGESGQTSSGGVTGEGTQAGTQAAGGPGASALTSGHGASASGGGGNGYGNVPSYAISTAVDAFCDRATGRLRVPSLYAAPCTPAYNGNNGGTTYNGVTKNTITIAIPYNQTSAATTLALAQDTDTEDQIRQTRADYNEVFQHHWQTYGRKVNLVEYTSAYNNSGSAAEQDAECQSDANKVAFQMHAFASYGDCGTNAYENTLVKNGVLCFCTVTIPASFYLNWAPYVWGTGLPDEEAAYLMRAEVVCNEIKPYPPQFAGEADLNSPLVKTRSFGLVWPGPSAIDNTTVYEAGAKYFEGLLKKCGANLKSSDSMPIIDTNGAQDANTIMAKYKKLAITDVIVVQDPIDPKFLTNAATSNNYSPEWIVTGSALTDETFFGRQYDQTQWRHAFGMGLLADRVSPNLTDSYNIYYWQFHKTPPAPITYPLVYPFFYWFYTGLQLAGPHLTPQTFQCGAPPYTSRTITGDKGSSSGKPCVGKVYPGLFGYPISPAHYQTRVANPAIAWGDHFFPWDSYNMISDGALLYWDATVSGPDESGRNGVGMYRYMYGGKRFLWKQFPKGNQPWFNAANTVTVFDSLPGPDRPPSYAFRCYYMC
jgi:hypothetical protein